jgi:hypothetical protein
LHHKTKHAIRDKARLTYGLSLVLKDDVDTLRSCVNDFDIDRLYEAIRDTVETLDKLVDVMAQLEYILYLEKLKG